MWLMMTKNKRFHLEPSDYDLKYEFRIADLSRVKKTKEDFWHEKGFFMYGEFITYLYGHNAFLTKDEADNILNELGDENKQLKQFKKNVLALINARIKIHEHKPFSAPVSNPANPNYDADEDRLARLSELEQLRKELDKL